MEALPPRWSAADAQRIMTSICSELLIAGKLRCRYSPGEVIGLVTCDPTGNEDRLSAAVGILHFTEHRVPTMSVIV